MNKYAKTTLEIKYNFLKYLNRIINNKSHIFLQWFFLCCKWSRKTCFFKYEKC